MNFYRTVGFYNIQDNAILETTSNPFWAAAIYYRLREVERDAANQPDDARTDRGLEQSSIQKFMALGILFNGGNKYVLVGTEHLIHDLWDLSYIKLTHL